VWIGNRHASGPTTESSHGTRVPWELSNFQRPGREIGASASALRPPVSSGSGLVPNPRRRRLSDLVGLDARRADLHATNRPVVVQDPHLLQVREPATLRAVVGVGDVVPRPRALSADIANSSHLLSRSVVRSRSSNVPRPMPQRSPFGRRRQLPPPASPASSPPAAAVSCMAPPDWPPEPWPAISTSLASRK